MIYTEPSDTVTIGYIFGVVFLFWIAALAYDWWITLDSSHQDNSDYPQDFYNVR